MTTSITSSAGILAMLDEPQPELQVFALKRLNQIVDTFWPEISEYIDKIEILYENPLFVQRGLASLVTSRVYYHLGDYDDSLTFALHAGDLFDINGKSEYNQTIIGKGIDRYTEIQKYNASHSTDDQREVDPKLKAVVDRMFERCLADGQLKQAVGLSLETRRLDVLERAIKKAPDMAEMLAYTLRVCLALIENREFRNCVLQYLVQLYLNLARPDFISVCQCLIFLDDPAMVAEVLENLLKEGEESHLMVYQIAFDLYESATQSFLRRVETAIRTSVCPVVPDVIHSPETTDISDSAETPELSQVGETSSSSPAELEIKTEDSALRERVEKVSSILRGEVTIALHLQFLIRCNRTDSLVLKTTKEEVRNSVCHTATVISNGFMNAGTTSDSFLRDNLEWLAKAVNWAKFTATASLGVIHRGHEKDALNLMSAYLPRENAGGAASAYADGGGLYALGLIHQNHGDAVVSYLLNQLEVAGMEAYAVRHGACLGLGLAAMGTSREDVYKELKMNLFQDDALLGEAAGLAMGLVMLGTKSEQAISDMLSYAQETQHEKIVRGLALGIALLFYGRREEADSTIETLSRDKDPVLRWCSCYTIAMAYVGSGSNDAIRRLLHVAVSDVNDDVRRTAVISIGFLLFRSPEQCPSVVSLLCESYNPHVRYGAAMALGIACAGTGLKEAVNILEPMLKDPVNYVRQGALIASALLMVQHNGVTCSKSKMFRETYARVIADKHEDVMAKFGAILAQGIIDAGGCNCTISLQSLTGHTNAAAVVGLLVFQSFWYWFPLTHFLSLAFHSTALIGLNKDLNMPKLDLRSSARPSEFAYPALLEEKKDKARDKVETAVLSITMKHRRREDRKRAEDMDIDQDVKKEGHAKKDMDSKKEVDGKKEEGKKDIKSTKEVEKVKKVEKEPNFEILQNPARVMKQQLRVISMPADSRYIPVKDITVGGIIMMMDTAPESGEELLEAVVAGGPKVGSLVEDEGEEPVPPEPFEWTDA